MLTITIGICACGRRGTLLDGLCGFCEQDAPTAPSVPTMTIAEALAALVDELAADIALPLAQTFTLAAIAADLCRVAGELVPAAVLAALDGPTHSPVRLVPTTKRGSFADWESQFHEEPA